jgi:mannose-1-phosphate guanylyltransferase
MICVHADWFVGDEEGFRGAVQRAADVAERRDCLVTVGVVPDRPETGFGYIQPGEGIEEETGAFEVRRFVEKPGADDAARFCKEGFLWNSGIFAWKAGRFLSEIQRLTPEVADALTRSTDIRSFFSAVRPVSVDHGVLERSSRVVVMPGDFGWDDVGTWASLRRVLPADEDGNVVRGRAALVESHGNVVFAGDAPVVLFGVDDLVVVNSAGTTLVTTVQRASDLKILLEALPAEMR